MRPEGGLLAEVLEHAPDLVDGIRGAAVEQARVAADDLARAAGVGHEDDAATTDEIGHRDAETCC
ncbi:MAG TPA: hypothetical protein VMR23_10100 [Candidatus Limnocylindria bacterium]|nr:hypothetical protein [Candidatus Limnocylindria bacterium]